MFLDSKHRLVVLDDDPTGMQTVHGCLVITQWNKSICKTALSDVVPFFFVLTNTRSMLSDDAKTTIQSVVNNVTDVAAQMDIKLLFLLRSDSTLRGHFPLELETVIETINQPIDGRFFIPAFFEGNRITKNDIHYIEKEKNTLIPCDQTEFANDSLFGYKSSHLPTYIRHKTEGFCASSDIKSISGELFSDSEEHSLKKFLDDVTNGEYIIVNTQSYSQLDTLSHALHTALQQNKNFIFQTSASFVKSFTQTKDQQFITPSPINKNPGLIVVGSHVEKTTLQLEVLLQEPNIEGIPVNISDVCDSTDILVSEIVAKIVTCKKNKKTPVLFTPRKEITFKNSEDRIRFGDLISNIFLRIFQSFPYTPSFLIAKGGITSHDVLAKYLKVPSVRVLGQVAAGVPVVELPEKHVWAKLGYVIFPGNVGNVNSMRDVFRQIEQKLE